MRTPGFKSLEFVNCSHSGEFVVLFNGGPCRFFGTGAKNFPLLPRRPEFPLKREIQSISTNNFPLCIAQGLSGAGHVFTADNVRVSADQRANNKNAFPIGDGKIFHLAKNRNKAGDSRDVANAPTGDRYPCDLTARSEFSAGQIERVRGEINDFHDFF